MALIKIMQISLLFLKFFEILKKRAKWALFASGMWIEISNIVFSFTISKNKNHEKRILILK